MLKIYCSNLENLMCAGVKEMVEAINSDLATSRYQNHPYITIMVWEAHIYVITSSEEVVDNLGRIG